jgi:peptidase E
VAAERQIVGFGGYVESDAHTRLLIGYALALTGVELPRVLFVPTAAADADAAVVRFYERCAGLGRLSHLRFHPWPPLELRQLVLSQDAICISGGNTANALAIWRTHGFDRLLAEAWERGIVLFGASAGMICWFEAGVTDSFGPTLAGMRDGLGFLAGSACPHFDAEPARRPRYRELVEAGFPAGLAADDGVGLHFRGSELAAVVSCRPGAAAYRIVPGAERELEATLLS